MPCAIHFETDLFDVTKESENPINPIYGESLLKWLSEKLVGQYQLTEPDVEDWGWYCFLDFEGRAYMLGASAMEEAPPAKEWVLLVDNQRTLTETLFREEKMTTDNACFLLFKKIIESEPAFTNIVID